MALMNENAFDAPRSGSSNRLVPILACVLVLQVVFYLGLRAAPWFAERGWKGRTENPQQKIAQWRRSVYDSKLDPVPGMMLPEVSLSDLKGRSHNPVVSGRPTLLLFVGAATTCSVKSLVSAWADVRKGQPELAIVGIATTADAPAAEMCDRKGAPVRMLLDPEDSLADVLNARWKPRAYLLDQNGRIAYVQPDTTMDPMAVEEVRDLLKRMSR